MAINAVRYSCGKPMFAQPLVSVEEFLGLKDKIEPEVKNKVAEALNIKDETKRKLAEVIVDRWMLLEMGKESAYVKHVPSNRKNVLYQIILGGHKWDGIYEFVLKGKNVSSRGYMLDNRPILVIESNSNYGLATFGEGENTYTISRCDYARDEDFYRALLATGLVSEEDLELYYKPDEILKPYLARVLPRVIFE